MAITHYIGVINQGVSNVNLLKTLLITDKASKVPTNGYLTGCPVEVGLTDANYAPTNYTNGCAVAAYVYPNEADTTKYDCVLYADVETIYAQAGKYLFYNLESVENITFDCKFSMANATDKSMYRMFNQDYNLVQINGLENFDTSNVTDMECMFVHCRSLTTIDVSHFDTSKVTNMRSVFSSCENIISIKGLENFNTANVTNMDSMFSNCYKLPSLDASSFDTSKVTDMNSMFAYCNRMEKLDLSNFDLNSITDATKLNNLFYTYTKTKLKEIKAPKNMNGYAIQSPNGFGMSEIDSSMEGMTLLQGSKEFNILYNTLLKINVCTEYTQAPELQAMYDGLSNEEKGKLATLSDDGGVILTDKLSYMVSYADYKANEATKTAETHLVISPRTSQYLVIVIACLSLALIGGYYFIQKKKYVK